MTEVVEDFGSSSPKSEDTQPGKSESNAHLLTMERLKSLPPHLAATNRRYWVEAVSDDSKAPLIEYYRQEEAASKATQEWAKAQGAEGFYPPRDGGAAFAFSFMRENAPPQGGAWNEAGRGYVARSGYVAKYPSKRPAGKKLKAEIESLPPFPRYRDAMAHLGAVTDLNTERGGSGVGYSDGKMHFAVPFAINGRYFINGVNHNYDILREVQSAAEYLAGDHPEWAPSLDYKGDPIGWRPGAGWAFIDKVEIEFLIAEENMRRAALRATAEKARTAPEAGAVGTAVGREPEIGSTREGADR